MLFPSPCGDYGSYRERKIKYFEEYGRFRPLAGIMVLIPMTCNVIWLRQALAFPSPCGDYGSYLPMVNDVDEKKVSVSVPLRGLWFLSMLAMAKKYLAEHVSVPLRGLWFLSSL